MTKILKTGTRIEINNFLWEQNGYRPRVFADISWDSEGYLLKFTAYEENPLATYTSHNTDVCKDSCVEFFAQFDPENEDRYFNFEVNPNGAMYCSFRKSRYEYTMIDPAVIDTFGIKTNIFPDRWEIEYKIPIDFIKKHIPTYRHEAGHIIRANFYKCGDDMPYPHYACWSRIDLDEPEFHCPQFFGQLMLE